MNKHLHNTLVCLGITIVLGLLTLLTYIFPIIIQSIVVFVLGSIIMACLIKSIVETAKFFGWWKE